MGRPPDSYPPPPSPPQESWIPNMNFRELLPPTKLEVPRGQQQKQAYQQEQQVLQDEELDRNGNLRPKKSVVDKQMRKTRLCYFHQRGICKYGTSCSFAHEVQELKTLPDLRKTRVCKAYAAGSCNDESCNFAHGTEELRATELCFKTNLCIWHGRGWCVNGLKCRFAHGPQELRQSAGRQPPPQPAPPDLSSQTHQELGSASSSPDSQAGSSLSPVQRNTATAACDSGTEKRIKNLEAQAAALMADVSSNPMKVSLRLPPLGPAPAAPLSCVEAPAAPLPVRKSQAPLPVRNTRSASLDAELQVLLSTVASATASAGSNNGQHPQKDDPMEICAHMFYALSNLLVQIQNLERHMQVLRASPQVMSNVRCQTVQAQALGKELLGMSARLAEMTAMFSMLNPAKQSGV